MIFVVVSLLVSLIVTTLIVHTKSDKPAPTPRSAVETTIERSVFKTPRNLADLLDLPPNKLEHCDIARTNLLCAEGLPGSEHLNVKEHLNTLDQWARHIQRETGRNFHRYRKDPAYFHNSPSFYKMLMMAVVLYEDFHIRYNPKWIEAITEIRPDDHFAADSRDILIHGLTGPQRMGTCSSMPVLYVALARRLGYPVKLVTTKAHLFLRWDSPDEKFNMDATSKGLNRYTDERYKQWPLPVTDEEIKAEGYLQSLTPAQELSVFLNARAMCLREAGRLKDAITAHTAALRLEPRWRMNHLLLADAKQVYANTSIERP